MSKDCIFCDIVAGRIPCTKVYEDADTLAFMDIGPVTRGHTLVIPKEHLDPITSVPPDMLGKLILTVQKVARAHLKGLGAEGINVTQANGEIAGQAIPHVHFHVIPRTKRDTPAHNWEPGKYSGTDEINLYAGKIRNAMEK